MQESKKKEDTEEKEEEKIGGEQGKGKGRVDGKSRGGDEEEKGRKIVSDGG